MADVAKLLKAMQARRATSGVIEPKPSSSTHQFSDEWIKEVELAKSMGFLSREKPKLSQLQQRQEAEFAALNAKHESLSEDILKRHPPESQAYQNFTKTVFDEQYALRKSFDTVQRNFDNVPTPAQNKLNMFPLTAAGAGVAASVFAGGSTEAQAGQPASRKKIKMADKRKKTLKDYMRTNPHGIGPVAPALDFNSHGSMSSYNPSAGSRAESAILEQFGNGTVARRTGKFSRSLLDQGPIPAKLFDDIVVQQPGRAIDAITETIQDPTLPNATNAGLQSAMALLKPVQGLKILGAGYGLAAGQDIGGDLMSSASAADSSDVTAFIKKHKRNKTVKSMQSTVGVNADGRPGQNTREAVLRYLNKKEDEARVKAAEAKARNSTKTKMKTLEQKGRNQALIEATKIKARIKAETDSSGVRKKQNRYDDAVKNAVAARDRELARDTKFTDTSVGKLFQKTGGFAPALAAFATGKLARAATGGGTFAREYAVPGLLGAAAGATTTNVPLAFDAYMTPTDNPVRSAYDAYARNLPSDHPEQQRAADYANSLPRENPRREIAANELREGLIPRSIIGGAEGLMSGSLGSHAVQATGRAFGALPSIPGRARAAYHGSQLKGDSAKSARRLERETQQFERETAASTQQHQLQTAAQTHREKLALQQQTAEVQLLEQEALLRNTGPATSGNAGAQLQGAMASRIQRGQPSRSDPGPLPRSVLPENPSSSPPITPGNTTPVAAANQGVDPGREKIIEALTNRPQPLGNGVDPTVRGGSGGVRPSGFDATLEPLPEQYSQIAQKYLNAQMGTKTNRELFMRPNLADGPLPSSAMTSQTVARDLPELYAQQGLPPINPQELAYRAENTMNIIRGGNRAGRGNINERGGQRVHMGQPSANQHVNTPGVALGLRNTLALPAMIGGGGAAAGLGGFGNEANAAPITPDGAASGEFSPEGYNQFLDQNPSGPQTAKDKIIQQILQLQRQGR